MSQVVIILGFVLEFLQIPQTDSIEIKMVCVDLTNETPDMNVHN